MKRVKIVLIFDTERSEEELAKRVKVYLQDEGVPSDLLEHLPKDVCLEGFDVQSGA